MNPIALIIILIIFVIIAVVVMLVLGNQDQVKKEKAFSIITGHTDPAATKKTSEKDEQSHRRAAIAKKLQEQKDAQGKSAKDKPTIGIMMEQAGLTSKVKKFWTMSFISMAMMFLLGKIMGVSPFLLILMSIIGLFGLPRLVIRHMTQRRQKKFLEEFPDALEAMVRLLKAGMPVSEAISMIAKEFDGPVGDEMRRVYDKQKIGIPLYEAAYEATRTMPLTEMQMFATGLAIQAQTGSSLSDVLINLAGVIRSRFRLKRKIKALSSEAIASASIIGALPITVSFGLWFVNPTYIELLFTDSFGKVLLAGAVIWMCIGIFVMKIMINFKI